MPEEERAAPGLQDVPGLVKTVLDRLVDLGTARVELAQAEMRDEVRRWFGRAVHVAGAIAALLLAFGLLNVALVAWLSTSIGLVPAALLLAAVYGAAGGGWLVWFRKTGGLNRKPEGGER
jgi:hypothetical protein